MQVATVIAVYPTWGFAKIQGCGWGWAGVIWLFSLVTYIPLDLLKFAIRYILGGKAWDNLLENKVTFSTNILVFGNLCFILNLWLSCFLSYNRLPLQLNLTMGKNNERLSGLLLRGPSTGCNHLKPLTFSLTRTVTGSFQRLQSKPNDGQRWKGKAVVTFVLGIMLGVSNLRYEIVSKMMWNAEYISFDWLYNQILFVLFNATSFDTLLKLWHYPFLALRNSNNYFSALKGELHFCPSKLVLRFKFYRIDSWNSKTVNVAHVLTIKL